MWRLTLLAGQFARVSKEVTMETRSYTVVFDREPDGGYHAFVPALRGCHSQGDSLDEATDNIREAMDVYLESLRAHGEPMPLDDVTVRPVEIAA